MSCMFQSGKLRSQGTSFQLNIAKLLFKKLILHLQSSTRATRLQQQSDQRVQATTMVDNRQSRLSWEQQPQVRHGSEGRNGAVAQNSERSAFCQLLVNASLPRFPVRCQLKYEAMTTYHILTFFKGPSPHVPCLSPLEPPIKPDTLGPNSALERRQKTAMRITS
jgi:hypothetical protein